MREAFRDPVHRLAHAPCREAYPNIRTVNYWTDGDVSERHPQSRYVCAVSCITSLNNDPLRTAVNHNKAAGFERRLELYLMENFKHAFDMDRFDIQFFDNECSQVLGSYIYYTQIMQAETLAAAFRTWRRKWAGPGREYTAGALVWQVGVIRRRVDP